MSHEMLGDRVETLVRSKARFLQFLERRLGDRADAEDLLQTAFLKLVSQGDSLRDGEKLIPWFYQLLRNLIVDHYRHRDAIARMVTSVAAEVSSGTTNEDQGLFEAVCTCVNDIIPALKSEQAEMVRRVELNGEPLQRAASDLGLTPNSASVRLHRARRALHEGLKAMCGICAEHGCLDCSCRREGRL